MKFSVVIPCYNAGRWIEQTLNSIANQTLLPYEVIVIDDGSTDDSLSHLQSSPVPTAILKTQNLGPASARNMGIAKATGDWVAFLDADDWWKPNHLERINNLVSNSNDVVYLAAAEHYSINVSRIVSMSDTGPFEKPTSGLSYSAYFDLYLKHGLLELSGMAIRLDRLQETGGFDSQFTGAEDFELMLRTLYQKTWAYDPIPSSIYRCNNPESFSRNAEMKEERLTAKFRVLLQHQDNYNISESILMGLGRTIMSKAVSQSDPNLVKRVKELIFPHLTTSQKIIFSTAIKFPKVYELGNALRNNLKRQKYGPRKVINTN